MKIPTNIHQIKQTFLKYNNRRNLEISDHFEWFADVINNMLAVMFTPLVDKLLNYETFDWLNASCSPFFSDVWNKKDVRFRVIISLCNSDVSRIILYFKWEQEEIYFLTGMIKVDEGKERITVHVKPKTSI